MQSSEAFFTAPDRTRLFTRRWEAEGVPKATVFIVHGVCEHSGRYGRLVAHLCDAGYAVSAFDLRGHGKSEGRRGDARLGPTFRDLDLLLERERERGAPIFLYGHSLGGLIVLAYGLDRNPRVAGAVASAAALHTVVREQRMKVLLTHVLGRVLPGLSLPAGLDPALLSRDPEVVADYERDPLVHKSITLGFGLDAMRAIDSVLAHPGPYPTPLLLVHGAADRVNYPTGSEAIAARLGDACTLRLYEGILHQPHTDPESPRVFADVTAWLDQHADAAA